MFQKNLKNFYVDIILDPELCWRGAIHADDGKKVSSLFDFCMPNLLVDILNDIDIRCYGIPKAEKMNFIDDLLSQMGFEVGSSECIKWIKEQAKHTPYDVNDFPKNGAENRNIVFLQMCEHTSMYDKVGMSYYDTDNILRNKQFTF